MKQENLRQSGKFDLYVVAVIVVAISILANFYQELFVEQSGSFQIFGNLGLLLVLGLFRKWPYVRSILSVWTFIAIIGILSGFMLTKAMAPSFLILLLGLGVVFYLTTFSAGLKMYLSQN